MKQDNHGLAKSGFMDKVDALLPDSVEVKAKQLIGSGRYSTWGISRLTGLPKRDVRRMMREVA